MQSGYLVFIQIFVKFGEIQEILLSHLESSLLIKHLVFYKYRFPNFSNPLCGISTAAMLEGAGKFPVCASKEAQRMKTPWSTCTLDSSTYILYTFRRRAADGSEVSVVEGE